MYIRIQKFDPKNPPYPSTYVCASQRLRRQIRPTAPSPTIHLDRMPQPNPIFIPKEMPSPSTILADIKVDMRAVLILPVQAILATERVPLRRTQVVHFHNDAARACERVAAGVMRCGQLVAFPALVARSAANALAV